MRITVLTGGTSAERDVALASAVQVVAALRSRGHQVSVVDTARGFVAQSDEATLVPAKVGVTPPSTERLEALQRGVLVGSLAQIPAVKEADVIFLALHGGQGEDGTVQAVLDVIGVPYTGSGPLGSALAMDKDLSKKLFAEAGVPVAPWLMAPATSAEVEAKIGFPCVVKPSKQGSTVGLTVVKQVKELAPAIELAYRFDDEVMIEAFIPGRELTVGVLDGTALAVGEIIPKHEIFDYECKYQPGMSEEIFPAVLEGWIAEAARQLAVKAHRALKLGSYSRIDFRLNPTDELICLEANTLPGMTATSLLPQSGQAVGIAFPELCERICQGARGRRVGG
ncbi:MAG TPA: D-alanine--D-alanine ligase [Gemmatimonadales bacterium]|nr:D-alanine--D-alanine ligase [Gemmatimonadales bacterium]